MERIPVRELNQHTSAVLARVEHGETVEITMNGRPIARISPIASGDALLDRLAAQGRLIPATVTGPIPLPPKFGEPDLNIADELAAAREEERW